MKTGRVLNLLGVVAFLAVGIGHVQAQDAAFEQRIVSAQEKFASVLTQNPQQTVSAAIFFTNDMSIAQIKEAIGGERFSIKAFRHGTQSYSGGYMLNSGETLDQAMNSYVRDHVLFLTRRMQMENRLLNTEKDPKLLEAVSADLRAAVQMKADFDRHGLRIIGIDVVGSAADLQSFKTRRPFVRGIELKEDGRPQPSIVPKQ